MDKNSYIIYENFDTKPKLLGIFNYQTIIISFFIAFPIIYFISVSNMIFSSKVYISLIIAFPLILLNFVFSNVDNMFISLICILKFYFSEKIYIYSKINCKYLLHK